MSRYTTALALGCIALVSGQSELFRAVFKPANQIHAVFTPANQNSGQIPRSVQRKVVCVLPPSDPNRFLPEEVIEPGHQISVILAGIISLCNHTLEVPVYKQPEGFYVSSKQYCKISGAVAQLAFKNNVDGKHSLAPFYWTDGQHDYFQFAAVTAYSISPLSTIPFPFAAKHIKLENKRRLLVNELSTYGPSSIQKEEFQRAFRRQLIDC